MELLTFMIFRMTWPHIYPMTYILPSMAFYGPVQLIRTSMALYNLVSYFIPVYNLTLLDILYVFFILTLWMSEPYPYMYRIGENHIQNQTCTPLPHPPPRDRRARYGVSRGQSNAQHQRTLAKSTRIQSEMSGQRGEGGGGTFPSKELCLIK